MSEPVPVSREDFDLKAKDLAGAKKLVMDLWEKFPETREMIESRTGRWFVWGQDRAL